MNSITGENRNMPNNDPVISMNLFHGGMLIEGAKNNNALVVISFAIICFSF
jgi:hypothetical protein